MEIRTKNQKNLEKKQKFGPKTKNIEKTKIWTKNQKKKHRENQKKTIFQNSPDLQPNPRVLRYWFFCFVWYSRCFFGFWSKFLFFSMFFFSFLVPNLCFFTVFLDFGPNFCVFHLFWFWLQIFVFFKVSLVFISKLL